MLFVVSMMVGILVAIALFVSAGKKEEADSKKSASRKTAGFILALVLVSILLMNAFMPLKYRDLRVVYSSEKSIVMIDESNGKTYTAEKPSKVTTYKFKVDDHVTVGLGPVDGFIKVIFPAEALG